MPDLYPPIEAYQDDFIKVSDIHTIHYQQAGNPNGKAVLFIHGGPGGGIENIYRQYFNPEHYRIILVDQRGCGQSTPHAELEENNTQTLIADFEALRKHLGISQWQLFGGSWGSTLALAYAQAHPDMASEIIIRGVFLGNDAEANWIFEEGGASRIFPDRWQNFIAPIPEGERDQLIKAYYKVLTSDNPEKRTEAALAWSQWEFSIAKLYFDQALLDKISTDDFSLAFARIECHYLLNHCFLQPQQLLDNMHKITHIPAILVQGRYDIICPAESAWKLKQAWPGAELVIVADAGHSSTEPGIISALVKASDQFATVNA